jgi:hypothetical protein
MAFPTHSPDRSIYMNDTYAGGGPARPLRPDLGTRRGGGARLRLGLVALGAALAAACAEGRAIFNVDVLSFIADQTDTVPYAAPPIPGIYDTTTVPIELSLLSGLGDSKVDTVRIDVAADLLNVQGTATVYYELHFEADSAAVYTGTPYFSASGSVNGPGVTSLGGTVDNITDPLFSEPTLWVGIRVRVDNSLGSTILGRLALSALDLRIVLDDRVF